MQVNSINNQNFGKIIIVPTIRHEFFSDAMSYIGKNDTKKRKDFYADIINLVEQDWNNFDSIVKICTDGDIRAISKDGCTIKVSGSNLFSKFITALKQINDEKYTDFVDKYIH